MVYRGSASRRIDIGLVMRIGRGFVANFLLGGLGKSYGLIMDAFQEVYQSGSALFMLAGGLIYTLMFCLCKLYDSGFRSTSFRFRRLVFTIS
ncbi:hypothetical protein X801_10401 [Opisthorchis viverrini]|uniref:Uncharacterized protein n=1 Tax=Opisthorchis viverrini TaxID=6198 RepID=A0A1S8WH82_OPIVI|nr:hypothetical protein X801_10401 [Opisthorchis viverrini]